MLPTSLLSASVVLGVLICLPIRGAEVCPEAGIAAALRQPSPLDALRVCLPEAVGGVERARVLAELPARGRVLALDGEAERKLAAVREILGILGRREVYEIVVIDVAQFCVALHARTVLLISLPALTALTASELQAMAAHELGHELLWGSQRRRETELLCDRIGIAILEEARVAPGHLYRALEKGQRFNAERFGPMENEADYPTLAERRAVILAGRRR